MHSTKIDPNNFVPTDIFSTSDMVRFYRELADQYEEEQQYQDELFAMKLHTLREKYRLTVPFGEEPGFYKRMLAYTKKDIEYWKDVVRKSPRNLLAKGHLQEYIEKEKKIKVALARPAKTNMVDLDIAKAKAFPMQQLIEIHRGNVIKCLWHNDTNPSMHFYVKTNTLHCFSCGKHADTIDVIMQLRGLTFVDAVKTLTV